MFNLTPWKKREASLPVSRESGYREWGPLAEFRRELDELMSEFFSNRFGELAPFAGWEPGRPFEFDFGIEETDKEYIWKADLPGFEPEEIDVKISGNVLSVQAQHKEESTKKDSKSYRYGEFYRSMTLPPDVDAEKIDAKYHSGVLELHLPKSEEFQGRRIEVQQT